MRSSSDVSGFAVFFLEMEIFGLVEISGQSTFSNGPSQMCEVQIKKQGPKEEEQKRKGQTEGEQKNCTYFGSYLISDRLSALRSIVRRIESVSDSLWTNVVFKWLRFDSSNARNASCVKTGVGFVSSTADGNSWLTAEFGFNALRNNVDCFFTTSVSVSGSASLWHFSLTLASPSQPSRSSSINSLALSLLLLLAPSMKRTERFDVSSSEVTLDVFSSLYKTRNWFVSEILW